jgi:hypothetical protein
VTRRLLILAAFSAALYGQRPAAAPPRTAQAAAPIDLTGYWVSEIVDEWRFRVTPQKGDIGYLPLNAEARKLAMAWDPDKDTAEGAQCKAYGAVGVMQRPGRLHVSWKDENTLQIDADAGTQTRLLYLDPAHLPGAESTWQGSSSAEWQVRGRALIDLGGIGFAPGGGGPPRPGQPRSGTLRVITTRMKPGYIRKNGAPYSGNAILTEYMNILTGQQGDEYLTVTAMVQDSVYLNQPFIRTYTFKKVADASGWDPTPCWPK